MTERNDEALGRVVRRLATYAKAMDISTEFLPAIAPEAFGSRSFRMDAVGDLPLFQLDFIERGRIFRAVETRDEDVLVRHIMADVIENAALVGALNVATAPTDVNDRAAVVRATLLASLRQVSGGVALVEAIEGPPAQ